MGFLTLQQEARRLAEKHGPLAATMSTPVVPDALLPILERLVRSDAHIDTLRAIATADSVVIDQHQTSFGGVVIRFIVLDGQVSRNITPLPGTTLELDVIVVSARSNATVTLTNTSATTLRQEFIVNKDATLNLAVAHINASGSHTRHTSLIAPGASMVDRELVVGSAKLMLDNVIVHGAAHTRGDVVQCGVVLGNGAVNATGLLHVLPKSQDTRTFLAERWLLLNGESRAKAIPSLEIEANDVKASHSATVQPLDEEHLFYLQARGLSAALARELVVEGFVGPVLDTWPIEKEREQLRAMVVAAVQHG